MLTGVLLVGATGGADAGWFGSSAPKPLDVLGIKRLVDPNHMNHALRERKYDQPGWGSLWKQVFKEVPGHLGHYVRSDY
jgi:hypothetical protein